MPGTSTLLAGGHTIWVTTPPPADSSYQGVGGRYTNNYAVVFVRVDEPTTTYFGRALGLGARDRVGWATAGPLPTDFALEVFCRNNISARARRRLWRFRRDLACHRRAGWHPPRPRRHRQQRKPQGHRDQRPGCHRRRPATSSSSRASCSTRCGHARTMARPRRVASPTARTARTPSSCRHSRCPSTSRRCSDADGRRCQDCTGANATDGCVPYRGVRASSAAPARRLDVRPVRPYGELDDSLCGDPGRHATSTGVPL